MSKPPSAWDQQPDESLKAFTAFKLYLEGGDKRSTRAVARKLRKSIALTNRWSARHRWQERLRAWTAHLQEVEAAALEKKAREEAAEWAKREQEFRQRRWNLGAALLGKADAMLQFPVATTKTADGRTIVQPGDWNFGHAARLAEVGDKLSALATGQPTESAEVSGKDGQPLVPAGAGTVVIYLPDKEKLPEEES